MANGSVAALGADPVPTDVESAEEARGYRTELAWRTLGALRVCMCEGDEASEDGPACEVRLAHEALSVAAYAVRQLFFLFPLYELLVTRNVKHRVWFVVAQLGAGWLLWACVLMSEGAILSVPVMLCVAMFLAMRACFIPSPPSFTRIHQNGRVVQCIDGKERTGKLAMPPVVKLVVQVHRDHDSADTRRFGALAHVVWDGKRAAIGVWLMEPACNWDDRVPACLVTAVRWHIRHMLSTPERPADEEV